MIENAKAVRSNKMAGRIAEHKQKIKEAEAARDAASGYRRKDLDRHVKRLKKELAECEMYLRNA